jgi:hypothetical protein
MREWIRLNRGQCPVCNGASKSCRQSANTGLIFCRDSNANPTNYIYRGQDVWGFSIWQSSEDAAAFNQQSQEERARLQREYQQLQEKRLQERLARELDASERDRYYQNILNQLELSPEDRQHLLNRGFTPEQIINDGYKSIKPWQPVTGKFPLKLAGLVFGNCINCHTDGILCPIKNQDGVIVGFQIRLTKVAEGEGRYRWLTSATKKNPNGSTPHLNAELPIGVFEPDNEPENNESRRIWLTEGTAIKPSLARHRLNAPVIGAASGRFDGSPKASTAAAEYLSTKYHTKLLTFAIDAGDVLNRSGVPQRWLEQFKFFSSLGYQCEIAWWGQVTKNEFDIDELEDISRITFITPEQFSTIIDKHQIGFKPVNLAQDWAWDQWVRSRQFTPDIVINQPEFHFPENIPLTNAIISIKSGLGTGKTGAMIEQIKKSGNGCHIIGYRNNLLFQTIARAELEQVRLYHLREDDGYVLIQDEHTHQAYCLDSVHHLENCFQDRDIFIDESCSVLIHALNGGTLSENQGRAIRIFSSAINQCNRVFLLDGNNSDLYSDFFARVALQKQLVKIENTHLIRPHQIKFIDAINLEGEIKKHDRSPLIKMLLDPQTKPWIFCDSKERTQVLGKLLSDAGKVGIILNSETASEDWAKKFLENPDKYIESNQPQFVILSPSAESGISVTIKNYFTEKFAFFSGVLSTNSQMQALIRLRDDTIPHYIFCPERSLINDRSKPGTYSIKKYQEIINSRIFQSSILATESANNPARALEVIGAAISQQQDEWWEMSAKTDVLDNYEMDHLRQCLQYALEKAGHNIELLYLEQDESLKKVESAAKEFIRREHSQELLDAAEFDSIESAKKAAKGNCNKKTQRRIEKTFLMDRLPGIQESSIWGTDFIYHCYVSDSEFIRQIERLWLLQNFEVSQKRHEAKWFYEVTQQDFYSARVKLMSHDVIWGLRELNILGFIGQEYHKDSQLLIDFIAKLRERTDIQQSLRIDQLPKETLEGEERTKILGRILHLIGYKNLATGKKLVGNSRLNHYQCVPITCTKGETGENEFDMEAARVEIFAALSKRFWGWINSDKSTVDWESAPDKKSTQEETTNQPQTSGAKNLLLQGAISLLKSAANWIEVNILSQSLINQAWKYLTPEEDVRLRQLHQLTISGPGNG